MLLQETERGTLIRLQDFEGIFLQIEPATKEESPLPEHKADRRGVKELREALHEACEQRDALQVEVDSLKEAWGRTQERVKELWRINCLQLSEFDAALTSKEEEKAELRELCGRTLPQHNPVLVKRMRCHTQ